MPYHTESDHADCSGVAVINESDGRVMGCHDSMDKANTQMKALYANEKKGSSADADDFGGKPNKGTKKDKRLHDNKDVKAEGETVMIDPDATDASISSTWTGTLVVEDIASGDQRWFASEAVTWVDPPLTLRWKKEDSHGGDHDLTVAVGNITKVWRDGNLIKGEGVFDMGQPDGQEAARRVGEGFLRGISIDADDILDADVELVWPESGPEEAEADGDDLLMMMFARPEKIIYHAGRIRAATLCDIPAFPEAFISMTDTPLDDAGIATLVAGAVSSHSSGTSDSSWDGPANEARLPTPVPVATARAAYAWIEDGAVEDGKLPKSACRFIHHDVSGDGRPGAANLTACSTGIGVLNGGRGGTTIPSDQKRGVYNHLAAHLRAGDREPPEFQGEAQRVLTAAGYEMDKPPRAWFDNPHLTVPMNVVVTDEGRVYGHAAHWGECHIGHPDLCVTAPYEDEHPYFMTGEIVCSDGKRVHVGQITIGTGHAPLAYDARRAAEHYDNTGAAVADVAVGNDTYGIWVAGAVRDIDDRKARELRAAGKVSGDWRRIAGDLRLVGLLAVNVAGFQTPKARLAGSKQLALVAAGQPRLGLSRVDDEQRAMRILMDRLRAKVKGGH